MLVKDKVKAWKKDWEETTAKDGKEIKKQLDKMQQCHCLMNLIKNYTLTAITGVVVEVLYQAFGLKCNQNNKVNCKSRLG